MNETLTYRIGPSSPASDEPGRSWLAISGPAQRHSGEMAARIAFLENRLAVLEAGQPPACD